MSCEGRVESGGEVREGSGGGGQGAGDPEETDISLTSQRSPLGTNTEEK